MWAGWWSWYSISLRPDIRRTSTVSRIPTGCQCQPPGFRRILEAREPGRALKRTRRQGRCSEGADKPPLLAVSYLRVSTREQAERGGTSEGFSIPAQREANRRKADELGARIVAEFTDAGESARSAGRDGL